MWWFLIIMHHCQKMITVVCKVQQSLYEVHAIHIKYFCIGNFITIVRVVHGSLVVIGERLWNKMLEIRI